MRSSWQIDGETLKSIFAHETPLRAGTVVPIDFSIDEGSFGYVSFIDVVNGRVDPATLRGKTVFVGPTAIELGDIVTVPVYRALPGVVVQAFATQTVRDGAPRTLPLGFYAVCLALCTLCCALLFGRLGWRANAVLVIVASVVLAGATLLFYAAARSVVDASTDAILCIEAQGTIRTANPATSRILGCAHAELFDAKLTDFIPGLAADIDMGLAALAGTPLERTAQTASGRRLPVEITLSRVATEEGLFTAIVRDVSERQAQRRALEHQATHDPLTGLPNRTAL